MPKILDTPETVSTGDTIQVNRKDLTSYRVDIPLGTEDANVYRTCVARNMDANGNVLAGVVQNYPALTGAAASAAMVDAGTRTVMNILTSCGVNNDVLVQVQQALASHPEYAATGYYNGTRDALYATV